MDQIVIKVLLIAAFLVLAFLLFRPAGSARGHALRTIVLVLLLLTAILAVVFPGIVNDLAVTVGVGRGQICCSTGSLSCSSPTPSRQFAGGAHRTCRSLSWRARWLCRMCSDRTTIRADRAG